MILGGGADAGIGSVKVSIGEKGEKRGNSSCIWQKKKAPAVAPQGVVFKNQTLKGKCKLATAPKAGREGRNFFC